MQLRDSLDCFIMLVLGGRVGMIMRGIVVVGVYLIFVLNLGT